MAAHPGSKLQPKTTGAEICDWEEDPVFRI